MKGEAVCTLSIKIVTQETTCANLKVMRSIM